VHFPAAVGALGTIDSGPHATRGSKNAFVDLFLLEMALGLQEKAKPVILVLFFLCLQAIWTRSKAIFAFYFLLKSVFKIMNAGPVTLIAGPIIRNSNLVLRLF
jgi:hypothetical protein